MQEVVFHYAAYNESGRRIDSSYQKGQPARTRMGIQGLIPGKRSKPMYIFSPPPRAYQFCLGRPWVF